FNGFVGNFRVTPEPVFHPQAIDQQIHGTVKLPRATAFIELRFTVQRIHQYRERFTKAVIAKIIQAIARACCSQHPCDAEIKLTHARSPVLATVTCGCTCSLAPTQRKHKVPLWCPAVVSQFGMPGSVCASTMRTLPSALGTALCLFT